MRIGIAYPDQLLFAQRDGRVKTRGVDLQYTGLSRLHRELKYTTDHDIVPWTGGPTKGIDVLLYSMISFYDFLTVANIDKDKSTKIVIGGPSCINIRSIIHKIDAAFFGFCNRGEITQIISNDYKGSSLWEKEKDPLFEGEYRVASASVESLAPQQTSLLDTEDAGLSVGCKAKCRFCHYSWWNKSTFDGESYRSGFDNYEDFFKSIEWEKCARGGVSAIDGGSEYSRRMVMKPLSISDMKSKILTLNESRYNGLHRIKLYNMYGYKWEDPIGYVVDIVKACADVDIRINKKLLIKLQNSHFIPFCKTPMEEDPFNIKSFCVPVKNSTFKGENITVLPGTHNQGPRLSLLSTSIQRAMQCFPQGFFSRTLWMSDTAKILETAGKLCNVFDRTEDPLLNITTPNEALLSDQKKRYKESTKMEALTQ